MNNMGYQLGCVMAAEARGRDRECMCVYIYMAVCQNLVPLVNIKIAGKWMFIPLKIVLIGIDPYPYMYIYIYTNRYELTILYGFLILIGIFNGISTDQDLWIFT